MSVRHLGVAAAILISGAVSPALAQAPQTFASSADVAGLVARAKAERKPDQALLVQRLMQAAPYNVNVEYRAGVAPAAVHENEVELFYVIDGMGAVTLGGTLTERTAASPGNWTGKGVQGGEVKKIVKGDFFIVPENTAHWVSTVDQPLVLMSVHMPKGTGK